MKLKNIVLTTVAVGSLIAATTSMATFQLINNTSELLTVQCTGGAKEPVIALPLSWAIVESKFTGGNSNATCTFYDLSNNTVGTGNIHINTDQSAGYLDNTNPAAGYTVNIAHSGTNPPGTPYWQNIVVTVAKS